MSNMVGACEMIQSDFLEELGAVHGFEEEVRMIQKGELQSNTDRERIEAWALKNRSLLKQGWRKALRERDKKNGLVVVVYSEGEWWSFQKNRVVISVSGMYWVVTEKGHQTQIDFGSRTRAEVELSRMEKAAEKGERFWFVDLESDLSPDEYVKKNPLKLPWEK